MGDLGTIGFKILEAWLAQVKVRSVDGGGGLVVTQSSRLDDIRNM